MPPSFSLPPSPATLKFPQKPQECREIVGFSVGGELSDDYQNLLVAARKAVEFGYRYIEISIRTMVIDI
jgi:hypothetical protein